MTTDEKLAALIDLNIRLLEVLAMAASDEEHPAPVRGGAYLAQWYSTSADGCKNWRNDMSTALTGKTVSGFGKMHRVVSGPHLNENHGGHTLVVCCLDDVGRGRLRERRVDEFTLIDDAPAAP